MKFIVSWTIPPATSSAAVARFLEAGAPAPAALKMIGRWHAMDNSGFAVVETADSKALYTWVTEWSDVLNIEALPCLEDADLGAVLQSIKR